MNPQHPQQPQQTPIQQRKRSFLHGLANVMLQRGVPLPSHLTGIPYPSSFDPASSPWRTLDISSSDLGIVRLASRDVDLFKLWAFVQQAGGSAKINEQGLWQSLLPQFDLPDQFMQLNGQPQSTAAALRHYYTNIIGPFEDAYRKNMVREQQQRALQQGRTQGGMPIPGSAQPRSSIGPMSGTFPPHTAGNALQPTDAPLGGINGMQFPPSQGLTQTPQGQLPIASMGGTPDIRALGSMDATTLDGVNLPLTASGSNGTMSEVEVDGRKRKVEELDDPNTKRVRQKIGDSSDPRNALQTGPNGQNAAMNAPARPRQFLRRKITYIPFAREVTTAGGRDLDAIQQEFAHASQRPLRDLSEWGTVDIEALTMSLRSRISTELSYALTTFTILSLLRIKNEPFLVSQAPDLFDETLDLLEEVAFGEAEDVGEDDHPDSPIITHRKLLDSLLEEGSAPFASLKPKQGLKDHSSGPQQRPGDIILAITNILRNLAFANENHDYLARRDRLLDVLLRLSCLKRPSPDNPFEPLSQSLSLNDLIVIRKDIVHILINLGFTVRLASKPASPSAPESRRARRVFELLVSYFIDSAEAVAPYPCVLLTGVPSHLHNTKPPLLPDSALEVFTRISFSDDNRLTLCKAIPPEWLWSTIEALVHRLPLDNSDFQVITRSEWLTYVERVVMVLYSIAFFSPPAIKKRMKTDRQLSFTKIFLRLIRRLSIYAHPDQRAAFLVVLRRSVETLKLVDDAGDSFDASPSTMPGLAFGMGYGEHGESRIEKGMGLLSGYQEEITWGLMAQKDLDDLVFSDLISLVRVEPVP
ncbi:hypothetical protein BDY19DRAFT_914190 [Irpex rosettiformis]|uniref:Uncharacterized protein n=1 Tax=Irpex rosettiformis TaxID=378272 RepID=A0ACB8UK88_9APHY|nr:hypothetical protein BDY19DRAFT_914190 [Irpex rosettiformis]